jgi:uncharacterized integral membrane protein
MTRKRQIILIASAILLILAVIVIFQNVQTTSIRVLFFSPFDAPVAVLLLCALAVGFAGGLLVASLKRKATKK